MAKWWTLVPGAWPRHSLPIGSGAITLAPVHESRDPNGDAFDRAGTIAFSAALLSRLLVRPEDFA